MYLSKLIIISSLVFGIGFSSANCVANPTKLDTLKREVVPIGAKSATIKTINLNTADAESLQTLKGIGAKKAQEIVAYRNKVGLIKFYDDLKAIKGFTDKVIDKLQKDNLGVIEIGPIKIG